MGDEPVYIIESHGPSRFPWKLLALLGLSAGLIGWGLFQVIHPTL